jgi:hypothetical protein
MNASNKNNSWLAPIEIWLAKQSSQVPIRFLAPQATASARSELKDLVKQHPEIRGSFLEALLWLRIGCMEPAHSLVQDSTEGLGAYIHGFLHRMEGDHWNANYWFRRIRDPKLLQNIAANLTEGGLFAADLTDACEKAANATDATVKKSSEIQSLENQITDEWLAMFKIALAST